MSRERAIGLLTSLPVLGVVVAILTWPPFPLTPSPGLDASWGAGLYMAAHEGLVFGREIVFTYGPLGFLSVPSFWYPGLGCAALAFSALLHIVACTLVLAAASRVLDRFLAVIVAVLACSFLGPPLVVIALIASAALIGRWIEGLPARLFPLLIGPLAALALLVKVNFGVEILLIGGIAALALSWRLALRQLAGIAISFSVSLVLLWVLAGQPLDALPTYVSLSSATISGYSQAMELTYPGPTEYVYLAIGLIAGLAGAAWLLNAELGAKRRIVLTGLILVFGFACFKEGFVRQDNGHIALFVSSIVSVWFVLGWRRRLSWQGIACLAVVLSAATYFQPGAVDPIGRLDTLRKQTSTALRPAGRREAVENGRTYVLAAAALDPALVNRLGGATVQVDPYEASVAWALELNWKPLPVFQDYLAFTASLDRKNAEALESAEGPELILRRLGQSAIDGRLAAFDSPMANVRMLCNYRPEMVRGDWILLRKIADRCGPEHRLKTVRSRFGAVIRVPRAPDGSLVVASIDGVGISGLERLRSQLFRALPRFITLAPDGKSATAGQFRLVPGTAADGLIMSAPQNADYPGDFAVAPGASAFSLSGPGLEGPLRVEFRSIPIRPLIAGRARTASAQRTDPRRAD